MNNMNIIYSCGASGESLMPHRAASRLRATILDVTYTAKNIACKSSGIFEQMSLEH